MPLTEISVEWPVPSVVEGHTTYECHFLYTTAAYPFDVIKVFRSWKKKRSTFPSYNTNMLQSLLTEG